MKSVRDKQAKRKVNKDEYNTDPLLAHVFLFLGTNQPELDQVFSCKLAPFPTSLLRESGNARYPKDKSVRKNKFRAEVSSCSIEPDRLLFHGRGMLHKLHRPTDGLVKDLVDGVEKYIRKIITKPDVFLIFDRYMPDSIKSDTRDARVRAFRRSPYLSLNRELPPKNMCLYSTTTKQILIDLISGELCDRFANNASIKRLVITSKS